MSGVNSRSAGQQWAGFASIGAGIIHGAAIGLHAEHAALSRVGHLQLLKVLQPELPM
jgi:hypothetical protein